MPNRILASGKLGKGKSGKSGNISEKNLINILNTRIDGERISVGSNVAKTLSALDVLKAKFFLEVAS